jgi:hypothetical protein
MRRIAPNMSSTIIGDRPSDGSSSSSRRGRAIIARAIATICCWPPDSSPAGLELSFSIGNNAQRLLERLAPARLGGRQVAAELEVLEHRHLREEAAALGHDGDAGAQYVRRQRLQLGTVHRDHARPRAQDAGDRVDQRGLAGAVRADDAEQLPARDVQRPRPTAPRRAVGGLQVARLKHGRVPR